MAPAGTRGVTLTSLTGRTIGQHIVKEQLGGGGMADVYKAVHARLGVPRAIKVIRPEFSAAEDFRRRFESEARLVAGLRHQNLVQVHDFGEDDGLYYMVMEYVDGQNLKQRLQQGPLAQPDGIRFVLQVAEGLAAAHARGVLHRDLKPENIMINGEGLAILMDFGIARMVGESTRVTQTGMSIGTPSYMAPEQIMAQGELTGACDVFALGVVLFELLTGKPPHSADTPIAVMMKTVNDPMPLPRTLNPAITEAVENVILTATQKAPADRYPDARAFAEALTQAAGSPAPPPTPASDPATPAARTEPPEETAPGKSRIHWLAKLLAVAFVACGLVAWAVTPRWFMAFSENEPIVPEMVLVKKGCFLMGTPIQEDENFGVEQTRRVCIDRDFRIARYEETYGAYDRFTDATMHRHAGIKGSAKNRATRPVGDVSARDVALYIDWLNQETGRKFRLPTEAEWEYACRGGHLAGDRRLKYCGSDNPDSVAWFLTHLDPEQGEWGSQPVGTKSPNVLGIYDMSGNAAELTCSEHSRSLDGGESACVALAQRAGHTPLTVRGGSFGDYGFERLATAYDDADVARGFRLVEDVAGE